MTKLTQQDIKISLFSDPAREGVRLFTTASYAGIQGKSSVVRVTNEEARAYGLAAMRRKSPYGPEIEHTPAGELLGQLRHEAIADLVAQVRRIQQLDLSDFE
jgi:hypothetical protein